MSDFGEELESAGDISSHDDTCATATRTVIMFWNLDISSSKRGKILQYLIVFLAFCHYY